METLQRAVGVVVDSMRSTSSTDAAPVRSAGQPKVEGNPLLAAFRQMLTATVSEQLAALEARLKEKGDTRDGASERSAELGRRVADVQSKVEALSSQARALSERLDALLAALQYIAGEKPAPGAAARAPGEASEAREADPHGAKLNAFWAIVEELRKTKTSS